jgi:glycosidase
MNYPLADAIIRWVRYGNDAHFRYNVGEILKYPRHAQDVLWNHLDTHDTPRVINELVGDGILQDPYQGQCWDIEGPWRYPGWFDTYGFRHWELEHDYIDMDEAFGKLSMASAIQYFMPGIPIVFAGTEVGLSGYKDPFNRKPYPWGNINQEILKHYKHIGEFRKAHKVLFSNAEEIHINCFHDYMEITRSNEYGKMTMYLNRNSADPKRSWTVNVG